MMHAFVTGLWVRPQGAYEETRCQRDSPRIWIRYLSWEGRAGSYPTSAARSADEVLLHTRYGNHTGKHISLWVLRRNADTAAHAAARQGVLGKRPRRP